jgi:hypothetical protein
MRASALGPLLSVSTSEMPHRSNVWPNRAGIGEHHARLGVEVGDPERAVRDRPALGDGGGALALHDRRVRPDLVMLEERTVAWIADGVPRRGGLFSGMWRLQAGGLSEDREQSAA